jgi:hypothetical protein
MTLAQTTSLYFDSKYDAACKRVQALKAHGYIGDRRSKVGEPSTLHLTKKAFDHLNAEGKLADYPRLTPEQFARRSRIKDSTLKHELCVMDVRVAIATAIAVEATRRVDEFTCWPLLSQFTAIHPLQRNRITVWPDAFLRISDADGSEREYSFFLEVDRSNEVQQVLVDKALCYRNFYARGGFAVRCGGTPEKFKDYPFRLLIVLQNAERRNNLAERLMNCTPPVKYQAWLTTLDEVLRDPLGPIWICPSAYGQATAGTAYSPEHWRGRKTYVRRPEREKLVEERVVKQTIFEHAQSNNSPLSA